MVWSIPAALDCTCEKGRAERHVYTLCRSYVHNVQVARCTVWTRDRYEGEWRCLGRRVRGLVILDDLDGLGAAFDLDVFDRLGAALDLDGLDRLRAASSPVAFDPEACRH